jgi:hypothetical protein
MQQNHTIQRAKERYGLRLDDRAIREIIGIIQNGNGHLIEKQSNRVSVYIVYFREKYLRIVYDHNRSNLVTFLPLRPKEGEELEFEKENSIDKLIFFWKNREGKEKYFSRKR